MRVLMLGMMVLFGYDLAFQPVAGYNYGAKKSSRVFGNSEIFVDSDYGLCSGFYHYRVDYTEFDYKHLL